MGPWIWAWMAGTGLGSPSGEVQPVALHAGASERYAAWRRQRGLSSAALACEPVWRDVLDVCLWKPGSKPESAWVHSTQDSPETGAQVRRRSSEVVAAARLRSVVDMPHRYLVLATDDGWAAAGLLRPDLVAQRLGGLPIRVAMPAQGLLVAYKPMGPALDRVMAIGVREMHDASERRLSPKVFEWDGTAWSPFGEAVPTPPEP